MPADKYRFISPGVFITEVDQSQIPNLDQGTRGPLIIGRANKGPAFQPIRVTSMDQFEQIFGQPVPGGNATPDSWRNQGMSSPMYGTYAAEAYLRNNQPVTFVRLLGAEHPDATTTVGVNGWKVPSMTATGGGAYGLFVWPSASNNATASATLAAVWYCNSSASITLTGAVEGSASFATASNGVAIKSEVDSGYQFKVIVKAAGASNVTQSRTFDFTRNSSNYIRNIFNTDATKLNSTLYATADGLQDYILGQTYERAIADQGTITNGRGMILKLGTPDADGGDFTSIKDSDGSPPVASTGWFISQDTGLHTEFIAERDGLPLFKVKGLHVSGQKPSDQIKISIRDIRFPSPQEQSVNPYPAFTLEVRSMKDTDKKKKPLETFTDLNLNPSSQNYIAARIGDKYLEYDTTNKRLTERGDFNNLSKYIRVEMHNSIAAGGANPSLMPFGVIGPDKFISTTITAATCL